MKKALLFTFTFFFGANLMAQLAPNKVLNSSNKALINDKVIMSGDEVLKDLMQAPRAGHSGSKKVVKKNAVKKREPGYLYYAKPVGGYLEVRKRKMKNH